MKTGTVTGTLYDMEGLPLVGKITFTPYVRTAIVDASTDSVFFPKPTVVTLVAGAFTVTLVATDDPDLTPTGWTYEVTVSSREGRYGFPIEVPALSTRDLADIVPVASSEGTYILSGITPSVLPPENPVLNQLWIPL